MQETIISQWQLEMYGEIMHHAWDNKGAQINEAKILVMAEKTVDNNTGETIHGYEKYAFIIVPSDDNLGSPYCNNMFLYLVENGKKSIFGILELISLKEVYYTENGQIIVEAFEIRKFVN